jgi:hypothetical protein|tara:strand:+ start:5091 stop:5273 length:183 start_codon:yes stop_codon:yes gene_type:complete
MIIGFNDDHLECTHTLIKTEENKYYEAIFEDRDVDASKHAERLKHLKKLFASGEHFIPKF